MIGIIGGLAYVAITTAVVPILLTRGSWQVWRPKLALVCWHTALTSSVLALLVSATSAIGLAYTHGSHGRGAHALIFSLAVWSSGFCLAAWCSLLLGRSEPVVRCEQGVQRHLRFAALNCRQSVEERAGTTIRYVDTDAPVAYSFHAPEATVVISRLLQQRLSTSELDAIIAHECAHLKGHHHLAVRLASIHSACLPTFAPARRVRSSTQFLVELIADDVAAAQCGSEVAESALAIMADLTSRPELTLRAQRLHVKRITPQHAPAWTRVRALGPMLGGAGSATTASTMQEDPRSRELRTVGWAPTGSTCG